MKAPELLSPAGNFESLKAAVENGADAVYLGGREFNARRNADNFDRKELKKACIYAHLKGVKIYVTINILLSDEELKQVGDFIEYLCDIGVDGIIIQDVGLASFIRSNFKDVKLHASTQMTIHNVEGAKLLKDLNFNRIVLARELSLEEIIQIKFQTGLEIESFVHGALCFCYSGQCLMSSFIGGRSGNRGQCAQPCRMPYNLVNEKGERISEKGYLLSPKDLNMIEYLPLLIEAGIDSFKIEGRLKRPEYVALVTSIYRKAIDRFIENPEKYSVTSDEKRQLAKMFNRGFTTGYYFNNPGARLISIDCPKNKGILLGKVVDFNVKTNRAKILLYDELKLGDGIDFRGKEGFGHTVTKLYKGDVSIEQADKGDVIEIATKRPLNKGITVYKTYDDLLFNTLKDTYINPDRGKKIDVDVQVVAKKGMPFEIKMTDEDGNEAFKRSDFIAAEAHTTPLTEELLKNQIDRLGNTVFKLRNFKADIGDDVIVPFSIINEIRRETVRELEKSRLEKKYKSRPTGDRQVFFSSIQENAGNLVSATPKLSVRVSDYDAAKAAILSGADIIYFGSCDMYKTQNVYKDVLQIPELDISNFYIVLPTIVSNTKMAEVKSFLKELKHSGVNGVVAGNLGTLYESINNDFKVVADFTLNTFNSISLRFLNQLGIQRAILSTELTINQIKEMTKLTQTECIIQGRLPIMISEHNLIGANTKNGIIKAGLKDRLGMVFPIEIDEDYRTHIYNCHELCMINHLGELKNLSLDVLQLYLPGEEEARVRRLTDMYKKALFNDEKMDETMISPDYTHGHFYRGVI